MTNASPSITEAGSWLNRNQVHDGDSVSLLDAVKALTQPTVEYVTQETDTGTVTTAVPQPPLLTLLQNGTGRTRRPKSASIPIPIDADALEIEAQIREHVALWSRRLSLPFKGDLIAAVTAWHEAHAAAVRAGRHTTDDDLAATIAAESWVRMITNKFEPQDIREWTSHCVNDTTEWDGDSLVRARCGARRIVVDGIERFAIELNVTEKTATCHACGHVWSGEAELMQLRFLTNIDQAARNGGDVDPNALRVLNP